MRHRVAHRKLGRLSEHRIALLRSQAAALIRHERIETTLAKAKELRPFVERLITVAKRSQNGEKTSAQKLFARRLVLRDLSDRRVVAKLFDTIAPRYEDRPGGYTRILKLGFRRGDGADVAQLELVGSEYNPQATTTTTSAPKRGVGGRLRAAARRLRGEAKGPAAKTSAKTGTETTTEDSEQAAPQTPPDVADQPADKPKRSRKKKKE
ncbi:MAG: 50S ribosomal protein L17 [Luteitalea sp.]|nr:50S ribosomal protein L17 [Luteitalea sp.]